ncbi:hypothetical protein SODALDRAFT_266521 [Sodiomyces alkalinus F11]|uniref:TEA domain-containing protein n=1 Tax=Sodiomyces alkalinus (strain CBS 110278 / VKM F-3762 / F11) TaxID=1314773 RepID=A0A3N2Q662_SODAK|nr:hypothetical protein SODALDRAFT_266521 [Sodiomyces alkalinus F11]ROT42269.1 hypothetical protein SODALDRAFT_266521 [Sodiomyces alkalinus F11]
MEHHRPVLPSQHPSSTYGYDHHQGGGPSSSHSRPPLRESTGNAQHLSVVLSSSCRQAPSLGIYSPSLPPSIPTPVVPSQAGPQYCGGSGSGRMSGFRSRADQLRLARRPRHDINPIYFAPEFRPYRDKQDQKDPNEKQIWPRVLEDAFLDSLLIIPHMGRKKYSMQGKQFGRNMLISEYLWIAYCCSLQPGQKAEERKRKQVSSHIQVVKKMFEKHRCYHFFFVKDAEKSEARLKENNAEMASFKDNPVLIALSEGRLPDVRPNYEYFAQILAMDSQVVMRAKTCWIFVSSSDVTLDEGTGTAFDRNGKALDTDMYPHLEKNLHRETDSGLARGLAGGGVLLHEYNRELTQKESAAATEISQDWEVRFPVLHRSLEAATAENRWLDMLELTITLELHPRSNFPTGSELNGFVELSIAQPHLQNHRWKCVTLLQRPEELCRAGEGGSVLVEQTSEVGVQYMHRPGCGRNSSAEGGSGGLECDCRTRPRQDVRVPFPAAEWASILSSCAGYLQEPIDARSRAGGASGDDAKAAEQATLDSERTTAELIQQIAMFQELWSCPPDAAPNRRKWTRRGVLLWKFRTVYAFDDKGSPVYEKVSATKGRKVSLDGDDDDTGSGSSRRSSKAKRMYHPPGTTWRFLTALDPISPEHQRNVCVNPATNNSVPNRDMVMAPTPSYPHHITAAMSENLSAAWDTVTMPGQLPSLTSAGTMNLLDSFSQGVATPPPTASLHSSYAPSFDGNHDQSGRQHTRHHQQQQPQSQPQNPQSNQQQSQQLDFLSSACPTSIDHQSTLVSDVSSAETTDPFLSVAGGMSISGGMDVGGFDDGDGNGLQSWDATTTATSFSGLDQWSGWDSTVESGKTAPQPWQNDNQRNVGANGGLWPVENGKDSNQNVWAQPSWAQAVSAATGTDARTGWPSVDQRLLPSLDQISPLRELGTRKRARSNSLDMVNRENFPATAIQKLVHHGAMPVGMLDGGHGHANPRW